MNCGSRVLQPGEMTGEKEWLAAIGPQRFINRITEEKAVIQYGDLGVVRSSDYAVDVDTGAGLHSSRARSHNMRCFSGFDVRPDDWSSGRSPKLMFMGAKCFCGVDT